jgi:hypothetical protein
MTSISSRERMLAALACQEPDHVPCSFMLFHLMKPGSKDYRQFVERQVALGLDTYVQIPSRPPVVRNDWYDLHGLPVSYDPRVTTKEWIEHRQNEPHPMLIKEYHTPGGILRAEVSQDPEWKWGNHVPLFDDFLETRSKKFIINQENDLDAFQYLLVPPKPDEITAFREDARLCKELAREHGLVVAGGWGIGIDMLGWIHGLENMVYTAVDKPEFLAKMIGMIATWNRARMEVTLSEGIDLYMKRAWYENCDFWSPRAYRKFIAPILREDVRTAHQAGAKFGYIITSNCMPLLEIFAECGVDVLIGVDPFRWDMTTAKQKLGGKVCLWGGVNGHMTVELGTEQAVRAEVQEAMRVLAPGGGFILSPVDNVREETPVALPNALAMIDEWKTLAGITA